MCDITTVDITELGSVDILTSLICAIRDGSRRNEQLAATALAHIFRGGEAES